jgi:DNA modification methylase
VAKRKPTQTSNFGVGRRESHDASAFYSRFTVPEVSDDHEVALDPAARRVDAIFHGDSRHMPELADDSVALVVTSPPYFAGKEYEEALGEGHIPGTYVDFLDMLTDVFAECVRKLEPGGRIAVNVANLGRKPYRSLSADVIAILQDRLGLLLRGEIIWQKAYAASGSCAWGSFQSASNPVLRDLTERVIVASKGRFDRALTRRRRAERELPNKDSLFRDEFMEATVDLWDIPPESATRVGHPAPFPVELPLRLIELYTYMGDLVLDPLVGSGTAAVAALKSGRHFVGYDTDENYVIAARERIERVRRELQEERGEPSAGLFVPNIPLPLGGKDSFQAYAVKEGQRAKQIALAVLKDCKFKNIVEERRFGNGVEVNFVAKDAKGQRWFFDVSGAFTSTRAGLRRTDTVWKALGKAAALKASPKVGNYRLVFLTTDLPPLGSAGNKALDATRGDVFHDAIEMMSRDGQARLRRYAAGEGYDVPLGELLSSSNPNDS